MVWEILLYSGSFILILWGVAHIFAFRAVLFGFEDIPPDNLRIFTMEWMGGGMTLIFVGALAALVTFSGEAATTTASLVYTASGIMLLAHSGLTAVTGARTPLLPLKVCPLITGICAALFFSGALL
ncbi:MAG TPA: hypothetical protein VMW63_01560 [Methanoregulaceae archaeon]|nr:hypothetical protein [Methanoregulaceae archaeon]